ncbi:hypothetical protein ACQ859_16205 [Roseateles chitinivorans]|uniref:hypothetical protein n=1 Tax=Roseateles chitinivorans TaxID=2917965 RepID=UPI003D67BC39
MMDKPSASQRSQGRDSLKQQSDSQPSRQSGSPRTADQHDLRGLVDQKDLEDGRVRPIQPGSEDLRNQAGHEAPKPPNDPDRQLVKDLQKEEGERPNGEQRKNGAPLGSAEQ